MGLSRQNRGQASRSRPLLVGVILFFMSQLSFSFNTSSVLLSADEIFGLTDDMELLRRLKESRCWERKPSGIHPRALGEYFSMWATIDTRRVANRGCHP